MGQLYLGLELVQLHVTRVLVGGRVRVLECTVYTAVLVLYL
jgi:hypothetical protein